MLMLTSKMEMVTAYENKILRTKLINKAVKYMTDNHNPHKDGKE